MSLCFDLTQWASAWCMHALCRALPRKLAATLTTTMDELPLAHAELSAVAAVPRRGKGRRKSAVPVVPVAKLAQVCYRDLYLLFVVCFLMFS